MNIEDIEKEIESKEEQIGDLNKKMYEIDEAKGKLREDIDKLKKQKFRTIHKNAKDKYYKGENGSYYHVKTSDDNKGGFVVCDCIFYRKGRSIYFLENEETWYGELEEEIEKPEWDAVWEKAKVL